MNCTNGHSHHILQTVKSQFIKLTTECIYIVSNENNAKSNHSQLFISFVFLFGDKPYLFNIDLCLLCSNCNGKNHLQKKCDIANFKGLGIDFINF